MWSRPFWIPNILTDLIPRFNTSKFLKKKTGRLLCGVKNTVSFRLSLSFPPNWKLSLRYFNVFIAFNFFVPALLGIVFLCCKVFEIVKLDQVTLLAEISFQHAFTVVRLVRGADFLVAWLVHFACLRSHVLRAYCNFESKQVFLTNLFGRGP